MQCTWALYTEYRYGWTPLSIGLSIFALGLSISVTQGLILPKLTPRLSPAQIISAGLSIGLVTMIGIGLSPWGQISLILICFFALMGIVGPTIQGVISRQCCAADQGISMGAVSSLNSFTGAVSPIIGTPLLMVTSTCSTSVLAGVPYFVSAGLLLIAIVVAAKCRPEN